MVTPACPFAISYVTTTLKQSKPDQAPETSRLHPIPNLTFDPHLHQYSWLGKKIPTSVTAICSFDLDQNARDRIAETKHIWEPRGNACHDALEAFLNGAQKAPEGDYAEWLGPLLSYPLWDRYGAIATEYRLVDKKGRYAGSCDFLLKGTDKAGKELTILGDLKSKSANGKVGNHKCQLGAYAAMFAQHHPSLWIDRCIVVNSFPGRVELSTHETQECLDAWDEQWARYQSWQPAF